jgi:hypothetical protein
VTVKSTLARGHWAGLILALALVLIATTGPDSARSTGSRPPLIKRYSTGFRSVGQFTTVRRERFALEADAGVAVDVRTDQITAHNGCLNLQRARLPLAHNSFGTCYGLPVEARTLAGQYLRFCQQHEIIATLVGGHDIQHVTLRRGRRVLATLHRFEARPSQEVDGAFYAGSTDTPPTQIVGTGPHNRPVILRLTPDLYAPRCRNVEAGITTNS